MSISIYYTFWLITILNLATSIINLCLVAWVINKKK
jgi:hypothetical protein